MKFRSQILTMVLAGATMCSAQLASSHATTSKTQPKPTVASASVKMTPAKPAVRVNGAVLTDVDITREMYAIFPYAQQHNGFPKDMEPEIRKGAIEMVVFEELLYQDAKRRNLQVDPARLAKAEAGFRKSFDKATLDQYLRTECNGSAAILKEKIRRSILIDQMLKTQVDLKAQVTPDEVKAYYDKNSKQFEHGETFTFQTISIIPPQTATKDQKDEAHKKILSIAQLGKAAKTPRDFGLIAEQVSEDDWHTKLGDRGTTEAGKLPPEIVTAARKLKVGETSDPIALDRAWVVIRLNGHNAAGKTSFADAKKKLEAELEKQKKLEIRAMLNQKLRKDAKIEVL